MKRCSLVFELRGGDRVTYVRHEIWPVGPFEEDEKSYFKDGFFKGKKGSEFLERRSWLKFDSLLFLFFFFPRLNN